LWLFYGQIIDLSLAGKFDDYYKNIIVVIQNFLSRGGEQIVNVNFGNVTGIDKLLQLATQIRDCEKADDIDKICYLMILNSLMEFVKGLESILGTMMDMIFQSYNTARCSELKSMVMQTFALMLHYNSAATIENLEQKGITTTIFQGLIHDSNNLVHKEFEIKRILLGFSTLFSSNIAQMPQSVTSWINDMTTTAANLAIKSRLLKLKE
jgi:hypothetical protein